MADGPQEAPALHNPAGVAEGKEAVQGAAEVGAAPPLPEAVRRGRWQKRHLLPEAQERHARPCRRCTTRLALQALLLPQVPLCMSCRRGGPRHGRWNHRQAWP